MTGDQLKKLETQLWTAADQLRANSKLTASEARIYLRCRYGSNSVLVGARTLATRLHFNLETLASTLLPF